MTILSYPKNAYDNLIGIYLCIAQFCFKRKWEVAWNFYRMALRRINKNIMRNLNDKQKCRC